jgi:pyrroloquinoline-quinone synthase
MNTALNKEKTMATAVRQAMIEALEPLHRKNHPFTQALRDGKLTKSHLGEWVREHYHFTKDLWHWFAFMYANCPFPDAREAFMENITEEMDPSDPHTSMLLRFGEACGLDRSDIVSSRPLPTTDALRDWLSLVTREESFVVATAALQCGMEAQGPGLFAAMLDGIRTHFDFTDDDIYFFTVHCEADVEHGDRAYEIVEKYADTEEKVRLAVNAVRSGAEKGWFYFDGLYVQHVLGVDIAYGHR